MKNILYSILISFMVVGGCGGGSDNGSEQEACNFVLAAFLNGPSVQQANSFWDCDSEVGTFEFQAFEDGTGFSTGVGPFTFQETGCREITFQSAFGEAMVIDIEGSTASGIGTFEQISEVPALDTGFAACVLVEL